LSSLPQGVLVISGTNGKTTTTKVVSEVLSACGLRVVTNRTGSNFVRGIAAALLSEVDRAGRLSHDIAVLELDEAHGVQFVRLVTPRHVVVLNVMRDQLDRFGEIDRTARLLERVASAATTSVVLNRDDARVASIADVVADGVDVRYFGVIPELGTVFVNDDRLYATDEPVPSTDSRGLLPADVELRDFSDGTAVFDIAAKTYSVDMKLTGVYNYLNAAAALVICRTLVGSQKSDSDLVSLLADVEPAFGRGETLQVSGRSVELVLVKNPAGFRLALSSFRSDDTRLLIAINDEFADGRDMSWLWDVDFSSLRTSGVTVVSGVRAFDMALRLRYDDVPVQHVEPDLKAAVDTLVEQSRPGQCLRLFCTYTAMLQLRRLLRSRAEVASGS
jgi:lipid II isoglutaminyl synthase (glutamine-hydrolysing)